MQELVLSANEGRFAMVKVARIICVIVIVLVVALPVFSQDRTQSSSSAGSNRGGGSSGADVRSSAPSVSSRDTSGPSYSGSGTYSGSSYRDFGSSPSYGGGGGAIRNVPNLQGTSFYSYSNYFYWNEFLFRLMNRYFMDPTYFTRFYRNSEPLLTPRLQRLAVRDPLAVSRQMLAAVDELGQMVEAREGGQPIDKDLILAKTQLVRSLAKKIREDNLLPYVDQRRNADVLRDKNLDGLGLAAVNELRSMVADLNSQLTVLYNNSSTATVSVNSLAQPSFISLSKGIERLCKTIETSAKRL
jgi:hypothetical protein